MKNIEILAILYIFLFGFLIPIIPDKFKILYIGFIIIVGFLIFILPPILSGWKLFESHEDNFSTKK